LQALFYFTDYVTLDLSGRRVDIPEPIDVAALAGSPAFPAAGWCATGR
jgi:hypothetical protein